MMERVRQQNDSLVNGTAFPTLLFPAEVVPKTVTALNSTPTRCRRTRRPAARRSGHLPPHPISYPPLLPAPSSPHVQKVPRTGIDRTAPRLKFFQYPNSTTIAALKAASALVVETLVVETVATTGGPGERKAIFAAFPSLCRCLSFVVPLPFLCCSSA